MSVIWSKKKGGMRYEIRKAGRSLRLYTNGIFHSQWNPGAPLAGNLWDLLAIPAFLLTYTDQRPFDAAILGVGGGAVINQLCHFFAMNRLDGVDLDGEHLRLAKRFFGVNHKNVHLVQQNASTWVECALNQNKRYKYVVEDIFCDSLVNGLVEPIRAIEASSEWMKSLSGLLTEDGILVMNFESAHQCKRSDAVSWAKENEFSRMFILSRPMYHNAMAVFCKQPLESGVRGQIIGALTAKGALPGPYKSKILKFTIHTLR